jgi:hypothetical protein
VASVKAFERYLRGGDGFLLLKICFTQCIQLSDKAIVWHISQGEFKLITYRIVSTAEENSCHLGMNIRINSIISIADLEIVQREKLTQLNNYSKI